MDTITNLLDQCGVLAAILAVGNIAQWLRSIALQDKVFTAIQSPKGQAQMQATIIDQQSRIIQGMEQDRRLLAEQMSTLATQIEYLRQQGGRR